MLSEVIAYVSVSNGSVGVVRYPSSSRWVRSTQSAVPPAPSRATPSSATMLPKTTRRMWPTLHLARSAPEAAVASMGSQRP